MAPARRYPRTSPAAPALFEQTFQHAPVNTMRLALAEPARQAALATSNQSQTLQMAELSIVGRRLRLRLAKRNDFGDGLVTIEDEDCPPVTDVIEVPREIVLEVGDLGPSHMAMLAM